MPQQEGPDGDSRPSPGRNHEVDGIGNEHDGKKSVEGDPIGGHMEKAVERERKGQISDGRANKRENQLVQVDLLHRVQKLGDVGEKGHGKGQDHEPDHKKRQHHEDLAVGFGHIRSVNSKF